MITVNAICVCIVLLSKYDFILTILIHRSNHSDQHSIYRGIHGCQWVCTQQNYLCDQLFIFTIPIINNIYQILSFYSVAVYGFSYFVESSSTTVDARFDASITTEITTALTAVTISGTTQTYNSVLFTGNAATLILFSQLIPIAMTTKVTKESYTAITEIATTTWTSASKQCFWETYFNTQTPPALSQGWVDNMMMMFVIDITIIVFSIPLRI